MPAFMDIAGKKFGRLTAVRRIGARIKGKKIDLFCESHEEALQRGVAVKEVFVIGNTN